jgi:integrase
VRGSRRKKRGNGASAVWELRVHAGRNPVTGKPRYVSRTFTGLAGAADEALAELVDEVTGGEHDGTDTTFGSLLDRWLKHAAVIKDLSPTTVREHKRTIEKNIKPALGDVPLREVDGGTLDSLYVSLMTREPPLSASSVRRCHAVIAAACKWGVKRDEIKRNPALAATQPTAYPKAKAIPTAEQVQTLISTAEKDDPDMAALIALAAVTGARRGELCGLRCGDVTDVGDVDAHGHETGTLLFERSIAVVDGETIVKPTKTHAVKLVHLDPFGLEVVRRQRARLEDRARDLGVEVTDSTPLLSYGLDRPISPDTASHYVRAIATKAGIDTHLHALRHFAASTLVAENVNVRTVAAHLGHRSPVTTLNTYAHPLTAPGQEAAAILGRALTAPDRKDRHVS